MAVYCLCTDPEGLLSVVTMKERMNLLREFSVPLITGVFVALIWVNLSPESYDRFIREPFLGDLSLEFITNKIFMVFFFGIAAAEITQSCLPGGDLYPLRKAVNPLLSTLGGVIGPFLVYSGLNHFFGSPSLSHGWGVPTATDIALAWLAARLVFGNNHPVISFLLLLAIADDAIGLIIIALFYPDSSHSFAPLWLGLTGLGMAAAGLMRRYGVGNYWPYLFLGGTLSWAGLYTAHLHPALALVFIVPFMPHPGYETKHVFEQDPRDTSTLSRFEHEWKVIVDFGLLMFGLANAGVRISGTGVVTWLVLSALFFGKTGGVFLMGLCGEKLGFLLPEGMDKRHLLVAGVVAGIGFTVALFMAGVAFPDHVVQGAAKMGAMLSICCSFIACLVAKVLRIRRIP